jgi:hypothetical protein
MICGRNQAIIKPDITIFGNRLLVALSADSRFTGKLQVAQRVVKTFKASVK